MPKENGIIHGDGKLKDGREGFGDVGNFTKYNISAEIDENHDADTTEEDDRREPVVKQGKHDDEGERDGDGDVGKLLAITDAFKVNNESRHARNIEMIVHEITNFGDGV